jgi:hypothetical protein
MSGTAGVTKDYSFLGTAGHLISEALDDALVGDPTTGLDYGMDYRSGSTRQSVIRTLKLGSPGLGTVQEIELRANDLYDWGRVLDWEQAATRITTIGGNGYIKRLMNTGAVASGTVLLESVTDRQDLTATADVDDYTRDQRRARQLPVRDRWVEFIPTVGKLPFDQFSLGDTVPLDVRGPGMLALSAQDRRVVQMNVTPSAGGAPERVRLVLSTSLTDLGT